MHFGVQHDLQGFKINFADYLLLFCPFANTSRVLGEHESAVAVCIAKTRRFYRPRSAGRFYAARSQSFRTYPQYCRMRHIYRVRSCLRHFGTLHFFDFLVFSSSPCTFIRCLESCQSRSMCPMAEPGDVDANSARSELYIKAQTGQPGQPLLDKAQER